MKRTGLLALVVAVMASTASAAEECVRYYDLVQKTVVESCKPEKIQQSMVPGARPLSVTSPDLQFPSGVVPAVVEKVIDPVTLQVRYEFASHEIKISDLKLPEKGTAEYRQALALMRNLAPTSSVLYFEKKEYNTSKGWKYLNTFWQLNNQIAVILVEQGLAQYAPNVENDYNDVLMKASDFAKENKLGLWKDK